MDFHSTEHPLSPCPSRCSEHDLGEDIYDCVPCEDEGDDIYEDIIRVEVQQPMVTAQLPLHSHSSLGRAGRGLQDGNHPVPLAGDAAGKGIAQIPAHQDGTDPEGFSQEFPSPACHLQEFGEEEGQGRPDKP